MKRWVYRGMVHPKYLVPVLLSAVLGLILIESTKEQVAVEYYEQQIVAAELMQSGMRQIRELRESLGIAINPNEDPNLTGLIGAEITEFTTSLGNLEAKRTATNPDFAALMVRLFVEAGLDSGDFVAIGASGSFPSLILATLSACQALDLQPLLIYSLGSSMYGANIPGFTFPEMLEHLNRCGLFPYKILAISMGGDNDRAEGILSNFSIDIVADIANKYGYQLIFEPDFVKSINKRLELYSEASHGIDIGCFVNIGGASVNFGETAASLKVPNGLVVRYPMINDSPERGLIFEFLARGVPVINLLNIKDLAVKYGLPIDPIPLPTIGVSSVYHEVKYNRPVILLILFILSVFLGAEAYLARTGRKYK